MGKIWMPGGGGGADLDVVTAGRPDVLTGKVIVDKDGEPLTGIMPDRGAVNTSLGINGTYTIPEGYHNGAGKVTQSVATMGGQTITPGTYQQTVSCSGRYMTGNVVVAGDGNLVAGNILYGKSIFNVAGNVRRYASITGTKPTSGSKSFILWNYNISRSYYYLVIPTGFTPLAGVFRLDSSNDPGWSGLALFEGGQYVVPYGSLNGMVSSSGGAQYDSTQMIVPVTTPGNYFYNISGYY